MLKISVYTIIFLFFVEILNAQERKTDEYSGSYKNGNVKYSYYFNDKKDLVYHGFFEYKGIIENGANVAYSGNIKDGFKDGTWKYSEIGIVSEQTLLIQNYKNEITQNFKNGYRDGLWVYNLEYEDIDLGAKYITKAEINYKNGLTVGEFKLELFRNGVLENSIKGQCNENGYLDGDWVFQYYKSDMENDSLGNDLIFDEAEKAADVGQLMFNGAKIPSPLDEHLLKNIEKIKYNNGFVVEASRETEDWHKVWAKNKTVAGIISLIAKPDEINEKKYALNSDTMEITQTANINKELKFEIEGQQLVRSNDNILANDGYLNNSMRAIVDCERANSAKYCGLFIRDLEDARSLFEKGFGIFDDAFKNIPAEEAHDRFNLAMEYFDKAVKLDNEYYYSYYYRAYINHHLKNETAAKKDLEFLNDAYQNDNSLFNNPNFPELLDVYALKAEVHLELAEYDKMLDCYQGIVDLDQLNEYTYEQTIIKSFAVLIQKNEISKAVLFLDTNFSEDVKNDLLYRSYKKFVLDFMESKNYDSCLIFIDDGIKYTSSDYELYLMKGFICYEMEKYETAVDVLTKCIELTVDTSMSSWIKCYGYIYRAMTYRNMGKLEMMLSDAQKGINDYSCNAMQNNFLLNQAAICYIFAEQEMLVNNLIKSNVQPNIYTNKLSYVYALASWEALLLKHVEKALVYAKKSFSLDSESSFSKIMMAHSLLFSDNFDEAIAYYYQTDVEQNDILKDFDILRKRGMVHPNIDKIKEQMEVK